MFKQDVENCFSKQGWLVTSKGFSFEAAQLSYALDVVAWLEGECSAPLALIEGDTGTGKTLGYLIPLLLQIATTSLRGVLATHTIALQNQMLDGGDVDVALEYLAHLNKPILKIQQLTGRQEFIDPMRAEAAFLELQDNGLERHIAADLIAAAYHCAARDGLIETFLFNVGRLPDGVTVNDICMSGHSDSDVNDGFERQRAEALRADLVITSHMMLLLNRYFETSSIFENDERKLAYVVVDEADLLPLAADKLSSNKMHVKQFLSPLKDLYSGLTTKEKELLSETKNYLADAVSLIERIDKANQKISTVMINELGDRHETELRNLFGPLHVKSSQLLSLLEKRIDILPSKTVEALNEFQQNVNAIGGVLGTNVKEGQAVGISWSPTKRIPSIERGIAFPARRICNYYLNEDTACRMMFTSATLTNGTKESFTHFKSSIQAYDESKYCVQSVNAPHVFGSVSFVLTPPSVPKPIARDDDVSLLNERWFEHTVSLIREAAENGPTMVLCVSFKEGSALAKKLDLNNVWCHEQGRDLSEQISHFKSNGGVLITPSAWEGISIRGESGKQLITQLVITRMPYVPPSPFIDKVYQSFYEKNGLNASKSQSLTMVRKLTAVVRELRQGFGRLIRNKSDVGTIWIADPRFPIYQGERLNKSDLSLTAAVPKRFSNQYRDAEIFSGKQFIPLPKTTMPEEIMQWL